jgi:ABC-2 type transport system permease protein
VPRRTPMFMAKAVVFGGIAFVVGELLAFPSFLLAEAIIGDHLPLSIRDPSVLRAVFGMGLYLGVLGLFSYAVGALVRHTGAAITVIVGLVLVLSGLARLLPGGIGEHLAAYLPTNAGRLIMSAHQTSQNLLSPWQGFGVFCLWAAVLLAAAGFLLKRRDI